MKNFKKTMLIALVAFVISSIPQQAEAQKNRPKGNIEKNEKRPPVAEPQRRPGRYHVIGDKDFATVYEIVKKGSFDNDKYNIIRVACIGNCFTSKQCASLLSAFSFDENKLKALKVMQPCLVDVDNYYNILKQFTLSSNKDKAAKILLEQ